MGRWLWRWWGRYGCCGGSQEAFTSGEVEAALFGCCHVVAAVQKCRNVWISCNMWCACTENQCIGRHMQQVSRKLDWKWEMLFLWQKAPRCTCVSQWTGWWDLPLVIAECKEQRGGEGSDAGVSYLNICKLQFRLLFVMGGQDTLRLKQIDCTWG